VIKSTSPWVTTRSSIIGFVESVQRFDVAWDRFLQNVDLDDVNRLRSDYNKYYPVAKAAAFNSEDIEQLGFAPLELATINHLREKFPPVELPALRER
jgi:hypothetical protein